MEWQPIDGRFRQISVNLGGVWALTESGDLFYRVGTYENCQSTGTRWWQVEGTCPGFPNNVPGGRDVGQGRIQQVSAGWNVVWVVDLRGGVWYRDGIDIDHVIGTRWVHVPTTEPFKQVSVGRGGQVWAIDQRHQVFYRAGATLQCPGGTFWKKVDERRMSQVDVGKSGVWAVDENKEVFYRQGTYGEGASDGVAWQKVDPDAVLLQQVSSGGEDMMLGVTRKGELFMRAGMSPQCPTGTQWKRMKGDVTMVDGYGYGAWAIDFGGRPVFTMMYPYSQEPIRPLNACFF